MKIHVSISVFTEDEAIGMLSGEVEVPIVPQIGDVLAFDPQSADLIRHKAALVMDLIKVTDRVIGTGAAGDITVMLSDVTAKNKEDALQIMAFFEDCHGLFADRCDEQDTQDKVNE